MLESFAPFGVGLLLLVIERFVVQLLPLGVFRPELVLPFVLDLGLHEQHRRRSLLTAFALGYLLDIFSGAPIGIHAFTMVLLLLFSQTAQLRLFLQGAPFQILLTFCAVVISTVVIFVLRAIFERVPIGAGAVVGMLLPHAVATAVFAPLVFWFATALLGRRTVARARVGL